MIGFGFAKGNEPAIDHVQVVAFYEPDTGHIRHVHTVTTLRGAKQVSQDHAVAEAKKFATRRHKNVESFAVALSNDARHAQSPHKIDSKTKAFVPVTRKKIVSRRSSAQLPRTTKKKS